MLSLGEIDRPVVGDDGVLIRVHAGVDQGVWHMMAGMPYMVRLMGFGVRAPKTRVRGTEVAGVVEAVGRSVTGFAGDEVFGIGDGTFAEYTCAREAKLAPEPANATFEQAAAVPVSGSTALQALRDIGRLRAGERVLVIGAGGGVGTFAVQLAKALGAGGDRRVQRGEGRGSSGRWAPTPSSTTRASALRDGPRRYDLIVDTAGNRSLYPPAPRARGQGRARDRRRRMGQPLDRRLRRAQILLGAAAVGVRSSPAVAETRRDEGPQLRPRGAPALHRGGRCDPRRRPDLPAERSPCRECGTCARVTCAGSWSSRCGISRSRL